MFDRHEIRIRTGAAIHLAVRPRVLKGCGIQARVLTRVHAKPTVQRGIGDAGVDPPSSPYSNAANVR
jgi:hypothetical protein